MPFLDFEVKNADALRIKLKGKQSRLRQVLSWQVDKMLVIVHRTIVERLTNRDLKVKTGILRSAFGIEFSRWDGDTLHAAVSHMGGPSKLYGVIHEVGAPSMWEIIATKKRALSFMMDGRHVMVHSITHPPLLAKHFVSGTADQFREEFRFRMQTAVDIALRNP
jgi:hypothetical protein